MGEALGIPVQIQEELREIYSLDHPMDHHLIHRRIVEFWVSYYHASEDQKLELLQRRDAQRIVAMMLEAERRGTDLILLTHGGKAELIVNALVGRQDPCKATVQYSLDLGAFHVIDLAPTDNGFAHINIKYLNMGAFENSS